MSNIKGWEQVKRSSDEHLVQTVFPRKMLSVFRSQRLRFSIISLMSANFPVHLVCSWPCFHAVAECKQNTLLDGDNRPLTCSAFHVNQHLQQCTLLIERSGPTGAWAEPHTEPNGVRQDDKLVCEFGSFPQISKNCRKSD